MHVAQCGSEIGCGHGCGIAAEGYCRIDTLPTPWPAARLQSGQSTQACTLPAFQKQHTHVHGASLAPPSCPEPSAQEKREKGGRFLDGGAPREAIDALKQHARSREEVRVFNHDLLAIGNHRLPVPAEQIQRDRRLRRTRATVDAPPGAVSRAVKPREAPVARRMRADRQTAASTPPAPSRAGWSPVLTSCPAALPALASSTGRLGSCSWSGCTATRAHVPRSTRGQVPVARRTPARLDPRRHPRHRCRPRCAPVADVTPRLGSHHRNPVLRLAAKPGPDVLFCTHNKDRVGLTLVTNCWPNARRAHSHAVLGQCRPKALSNPAVWD
jgi:hypothetical protein